MCAKQSAELWAFLKTEVGFANIRVRSDFSAGTLDGRTPVGNYVGIVADSEGKLRILLDEQNGHTRLFQQLQRGRKLLHDKRSQTQRELVDDQKVWIRHEAARDGKHLLL